VVKPVRVLFLLPPLAFMAAFGARIWIQSFLYPAPTGDDPAFHALAIAETAQNPSCVVAHLWGSCKNPLVESTWQYPNIFHILFVPLYMYTHDPIITIKILYVIMGIFIASIPVIMYIILTNTRKDISEVALISAWYTAASFFIYNNAVYTYAEGSIFELIGIVMLPIILYFIDRPVIAGALAGLAINSYTAAVLTVVFLAFIVFTRGKKYLLKFILSYILISNIFLFKFLIFLFTTFLHEGSGIVTARLAVADAVQINYPHKMLAILAISPTLALVAISAARSRDATAIYAGYALFLIVAATLWDRALRYLPLYLYLIPMQYPLHDKKARRVFAVATAGLVAFVLFNVTFYSQLFQPTQDLVRVGEDTIELYNAVAAKLAAKNATTAATICQLSSYLLPILQAHGINAYCLLNPAINVPQSDPLYNVTQALKKAIARRDLTPLGPYIDVLILETPHKGNIYNPLQVELYENLTQILQIQPKDGIYVVWIPKTT
jgi:hypothetical protein